MTHTALLAKGDGDSPIELSYKQRADHTYILGISGTGKSTLMARLAIADMNHPERHGLCVIDPHGTLVDDIIARVPKDRLDDVILVNPSDLQFPFAFNLFAPMPNQVELDRYASELVSVFEATFGTHWDEVSDIMRSVVLTLLSRDPDARLPRTGLAAQPAMDEVPHLFHLERVPEGQERLQPWNQDRITYRSLFYEGLTKAGLIGVREFWEGMYDNLTPRLKWSMVKLVVERINRYLANPLAARVLAQAENKLDFDHVLRDGRILLVNLSKSKLGEENSAFLGAVVLARLTAAVFKREPRSPANRRFHLMIDEFQNVITTSFPKLFTEGMKFGVDIVVAHQKRGENPWAEKTAAGAGNLICFELHGGDQREMAGEFDLTPPPADDEIRPMYTPVRGKVPPEQIEEPAMDEPRPEDDEALDRLNAELFMLPTVDKRNLPIKEVPRRAVRLAQALQEVELPDEWKPVVQRFLAPFQCGLFSGDATRQPWTAERTLDRFSVFPKRFEVGPPERGDTLVRWRMGPQTFEKKEKFEEGDERDLMGHFEPALKELRLLLGQDFREYLDSARMTVKRAQREWDDEYGRRSSRLNDSKRPVLHYEYAETGGLMYDESGSLVYEEPTRKYSLEPGRQRLHSDVLLELANVLAHLGKHRAMFKLSNESETNRVGRTLNLQGPTLSEAEHREIVRRTRAQHCRPRKEVQEELLRRHHARRQAVGFKLDEADSSSDTPVYSSDDLHED